MKTLRICIVASLLGLVGVCYSQNVSNVEATQSGRRIIISYDLDKLANIIVCYSTDQGKTFSPSLKAVSGDVGDNVSPGHKSITWSPLDEFESFVAKGCIFKVLAALPGENVLLYLDNKPIYRSEFQYLYEKNKTEETPYSVDEYLELFVNFRLKVCEAEHRGYQLTSAFEEEYKKYCEGAYSKLYDHAALDSLIAISYEHMRVDRRAAHIAVECPQSADKSAEALAMKKISQARDRVVKGHESFSVVARDVSTDPQVNETGGELGWITPFRYVYPLEEAVYGTPIGSVSNVFRTQYGFHIVLVEEEREHEEVKASHIMKMAPQDDETKKEEARKQIFAIYNRLKRGANFSEVAKDESDDKGSASRGGDLGWFGKGMMVPAFENVAFGMVKQGDISYPFETQYGWHVVQFGGRRTIQPFNELYDQIEKQVLRDERGKIAYSVLLSKVRNMRSLPKSMSDDDVKNYMLNELSLEEQLSLCPEYFQLTREYYEGILLLEIFNSEQSNYFEANRTKFVDKSDKRSFLALDKETAKRVSEAYNNSDRENVFLKSLKNKYSIVLNSAQIDFLKSIYR